MTIRLLPFVIAVAGIALALRLGGLLHDIEAMAEEKAAAEQPAPLTSYEEPAAASDARAADAAEHPAAGSGSQSAALPADPFELTDEEIELLQALSQRREEIEARAAQVEQREALLGAAENRIDEKIVRLEGLQKQIEALLVKYDEQETKQLESLVKIYESMKPKDAARIFEKLEMEVLLQVIERMKERKSAPVLAEMNPERAQEITLELATRRELPIARD